MLSLNDFLATLVRADPRKRVLNRLLPRRRIWISQNMFWPADHGIPHFRFFNVTVHHDDGYRTLFDVRGGPFDRIIDCLDHSQVSIENLSVAMGIASRIQMESERFQEIEKNIFDNAVERMRQDLIVIRMARGEEIPVGDLSIPMIFQAITGEVFRKRITYIRSIGLRILIPESERKVFQALLRKCESNPIKLRRAFNEVFGINRGEL